MLGLLSNMNRYSANAVHTWIDCSDEVVMNAGQLLIFPRRKVQEESIPKLSQESRIGILKAAEQVAEDFEPIYSPFDPRYFSARCRPGTTHR